jgi:hypothetical protein
MVVGSCPAQIKPTLQEALSDIANYQRRALCDDVQSQFLEWNEFSGDDLITWETNRTKSILAKLDRT